MKVFIAEDEAVSRMILQRAVQKLGRELNEVEYSRNLATTVSFDRLAAEIQ